MSSVNYQKISDLELLERLENGEMQHNLDLYTELMRRTEERGTSYRNTPEDIARWKADIASSAKKIQLSG